MSESINNPELKEEFMYLVFSKDRDEKGVPLAEIAQYRKGKFWFFGWEVPEPTDKFESWKELIVGINE